MLTKDLINEHILPLRLSDSGIQAMKRMKEFKLDHMPVIENSHYLGLISEEDILIKLASLEKPLGESDVTILDKPAIHASQPLIDVAKLMSKERIALVPVIDEHERYLGVITLMDVIKYYNDNGMLQGPGGMLVLEMRSNDYSLSEISRLAEEENAKIFNVSVAPSDHGDKLLITLKFNRNDLSRIIASFERHSYDVIESHQQGEIVDDFRSRYDLLMNFLNVKK